ncbi:MAG: hypothetical protein FGM15_09630 [Chthoniobacterales bacterium]|nr:hypothetical protein [Chthoniobacterales bacterium]
MKTNTANALRIAGGLLLTAVWGGGATVVATLSLMGTLMANDAGNAPESSQTTMVVLVLGGQILAGAAGIPLGAACFWRARRKLLLFVFACLLGAGLLMQVAGVYAFASQITG